jgi:hypothetical protein
VRILVAIESGIVFQAVNIIIANMNPAGIEQINRTIIKTWFRIILTPYLAM